MDRRNNSLIKSSRSQGQSTCLLKFNASLILDGNDLDWHWIRLIESRRYFSCPCQHPSNNPSSPSQKTTGSGWELFAHHTDPRVAIAMVCWSNSVHFFSIFAIWQIDSKEFGKNIVPNGLYPLPWKQKKRKPIIATQLTNAGYYFLMKVDWWYSLKAIAFEVVAISAKWLQTWRHIPKDNYKGIFLRLLVG